MNERSSPESFPDILKEVASYYARKLSEHGATPRGVDWNGEAGQELRFEQLNKLVDVTGPFSVNDIGCGYGAMFDFLRQRHPAVDYRGFDIAANMIDAARQRYGNQAQASFVVGVEPTDIADFSFASGIFNVRLGRTDEEWQSYIVATLDAIDRTSARGFAFNCLTSYSDADRMRPDLYYAPPTEMFDTCKRRYSRNVSLLHDYELYEFTVIIRKGK